MSKDEILALAAKAKMATETIEQLVNAAYQMVQLHEAPDRFPLKTTPEGQEWWRKRDEQISAKVNEALVTYSPVAKQMQLVTDELLDAAELPEVRGDPLDISGLKDFVKVLAGYRGTSVLPPLIAPRYGVFPPLRIQLDRLERRLRNLAQRLEPANHEPATTPGRRGRLTKEDSEAKRAHMLSLIIEHPSLKDYPAKLAKEVGASESTVRRWLRGEEKKYNDSPPANPDRGD